MGVIQGIKEGVTGEYVREALLHVYPGFVCLSTRVLMLTRSHVTIQLHTRHQPTRIHTSGGRCRSCEWRLSR